MTWRKTWAESEARNDPDARKGRAEQCPDRDGYETDAETEPDAEERRRSGHACVDEPDCHTETNEEAFVRIH